MRRVRNGEKGEEEERERLEFLARVTSRVRGWSEEEPSERRRELLTIKEVGALCRSVVKKGCILYIPASYYPKETPKYGVKKNGGIHW